MSELPLVTYMTSDAGFGSIISLNYTLIEIGRGLVHLKNTFKLITLPVILLGFSCVTAAAGHQAAKTVIPTKWEERAHAVQRSLIDYFWNEDTLLYNSTYPDQGDPTFNYWWLAHSIDTMLDGYVRTKSNQYIRRIDMLLSAVEARNGGSLFNDFYDDEEWMALALLRAYDITGNESFADKAQILWADIQGGWNEEMGGGISWRKSQTSYKNAPANGPAAILAARLYTRFKDPDDLKMAKDIINWMKSRLVDPKTGLVWDGVNREKNGAVDKNWRFTYNQGVYIGACTELAGITGDKQYIEDAFKTADYTIKNLVQKDLGILQDENGGDGGLFRGILVRYLTDLVKRYPNHKDSSNIKAFLTRNGEIVWVAGKVAGLDIVGNSWGYQSSMPLYLSAHLSAIMLFESLAQLNP